MRQFFNRRTRRPGFPLVLPSLLLVTSLQVAQPPAWADSHSGGLEVIAASQPETVGEQRVLVIPVNFQDDTSQQVTRRELEALLFNNTTSGRSVASYYDENSYGQTSVRGTVLDWQLLPITVGTSGCPDYHRIFEEAVRFVDGNVNFTQYDHVVVVFPAPRPCGWSASSSAGKTSFSTDDGMVRVSKAWINEVERINGEPTVRSFAHELGHNLGLGHAEGRECGSAVVERTGCEGVTKGDPFDLMGGCRRCHFNAAYKDRLGWLSPANVLTLQPGDAGTYSIAPLEDSISGIQALRLLKEVSWKGQSTWYYVEYRQPLGIDSLLATDSRSNIFGVVGFKFNGAQLRMADYQNGWRSYLLDATPQSQPGFGPPFFFDHPDFADAALPLGQTFTDPSSGIAVTTLSHTTGALTVDVRIPLQDTFPPYVKIVTFPTMTEPGYEGVVFATQFIQVVAASDDRDRLRTVEIYKGNMLLGAVQYGDPDVQWDTRQEADGSSHALVARTRDAASNEGVSAPLLVTVHNHTPALKRIGAQSVKSNRTLSFAVSAWDPNGDHLTYSASPLPQGATLSTSPCTFSWTPTEAQVGRHDVTFTVRDPSGLFDTETVTINVIDNYPPAIRPIPNPWVSEGDTLGILVIASDPDGEALMLTASGEPLSLGAAFTVLSTSSTSTVGQFVWAPIPNDSRREPYAVVVSASDGKASSEQRFSITVLEGANHVPTFIGSIGDRIVNMGQTLSFTIAANDPDGDPLTYSAVGLQPGMSLNPDTGAFAWTPTASQVGSYNVTFLVSDGELSASQTVAVTVPAVRRQQQVDTPWQTGGYGVPNNFCQNFYAVQGYHFTPLVDGAVTHLGGRFGGRAIAKLFQRDTATLLATTPTAITSNNTWAYVPLTTPVPVSANVTYSVALNFRSGDYNLTGTPTCRYLNPPLPLRSGNVRIEGGAMDSSGSTTQQQEARMLADANPSWMFGLADITFVSSVDVPIHPPRLTPIGSQGVREGDILTITLSASAPNDPSGATLIYRATGEPLEKRWATFDAATRTLTWQPTHDQGRPEPYTVTFEVSDGTLSARETVPIAVRNANRPPSLQSFSGQGLVPEGAIQTLHLAQLASDPDGDALTYSVGGLKDWMSLDGVTGELVVSPHYDVVASAEGQKPFALVVMVSDGMFSRSESSTITVANVNRLPRLQDIAPPPGSENGLLVFSVKGSDPDGQALTFQATASGPTALAIANGSTTPCMPPGPCFLPLGDVNLDGLMRNTDVATLSYYLSGRLPSTYWNTFQEKLADVTEDGLIDQRDLDRMGQTLAGLAPPLNAARFIWVPTYEQAGHYTLSIAVTDQDLENPLTDTKPVTLSVANVNQAPSLTVPSVPLSLERKATDSATALRLIGADADGDPLTYSATGLPTAWASLNAQTGELTLKPGFEVVSRAEGQKEFTAQVMVSDGLASTAPQPLTLTVQHVNARPSLALSPSGAQTANEDQLLTVKMQGSDLDGDGLTLSATGLPTGAQFVPRGDANLSGSLTRLDATLISYHVSGRTLPADRLAAADADGNGVVEQADADLLSQHLDGYAPFWNAYALVWIPGLNQIGNFPVTVSVSDGTESVAETVTITVRQNPPPVIDAPVETIVSLTVDEGQEVTVDLQAHDPEGEVLTYKAEPLPEGATFNAAPETPAPRFRWTPSFTQAASYAVKFTVSDGLREAVRLVTLTVNNVNRAPTLSLQPVGPTTQPEGSSFIVDAMASDPDGGSPTLSASLSGGPPLPTGAVFTDHGNATGRLTWTPSLSQAGSYTVTITVRDDDPQAPLSASETVTLTVKDVLTPWQATAPLCGGTVYTNIGWHYAMGYRFTPKVSGQITHLGGYFNGTKTVKLFDKSTTPPTLVAQTTVAGDNTWKYAPITPVAVSPTKSYLVAVYLAGSGASYRSALASRLPKDALDGSNTPYLTINGSVYEYTGSNPDAIPIYEVTSTMYGQADVGFVPDSP